MVGIASILQCRTPRFSNSRIGCQDELTGRPSCGPGHSLSRGRWDETFERQGEDAAGGRGARRGAGCHGHGASGHGYYQEDIFERRVPAQGPAALRDLAEELDMSVHVLLNRL